MTPEQTIDKPIILTEKATRIRGDNKVIFKVARTANKIQIREAIQKLFDVTVTDVNTMVGKRCMAPVLLVIFPGCMLWA
jgi:large subunit ribosomal protein L23